MRIGRLGVAGLGCLGLLLCQGLPAEPAGGDATSSSEVLPADDGWLDIGGHLDKEYGFLPLVVPISEPSVGYGVAAGPAFLSRSPGAIRPNMTMVGGMMTENGSWGVAAGDSRYWLDGRVQTLVGVVYATVHLEHYGIGKDSVLAEHPLHYQLEPKGVMFQPRYRLGDSPFWLGLRYSFISTEVSLDTEMDVPGLPEVSQASNVAGLAPSVSIDTRDNIFTPTRGTYAEASVGLTSEALGGDEEFQRVQVLGMQYVPLPHRLFLGLRGQVTAVFGEAPFYAQPFIWMRGVPAMRYQGEDMAQLEVELRWQFWVRLSLVGFAGGGTAWNDWEQFERAQTVFAGGAGLRYELARRYGLHVGLDLAFGPDDPSVYITIGSAWLRP